MTKIIMSQSSSITFAIIPLFALLLISGLGSISTTFAQEYELPDVAIGEYEIPTQEEIEKMMQQKAVSGKYMNSDHGVEVTIPDGWSGMASDFKDPSSGEWISGFQVMEGGFEANLASMQNGEFEIISLSIMQKSEENETDPPEFNPPTEDFDVDCNVIVAEKISVNNKDIMILEAQCEGDDISMHSKMYHFATNEKIISYAYMTSPSSNFENNIRNFENSAKTIKIENQVSVSYEIPEDMTIEEAISDARDTTVEAISETAEAAGNIAEDTAEAAGNLAEDTSNMIEEITTDDEEGGGCLIATAAFGTELAPQVQFLREIRDNTVMSTSSGAAFMTGFNQLYYSFSPTIADMERENPMFQEVVRAFITPMISTLSIMTLADNNSEFEVLSLGISVIVLNLGMYVAAPAMVAVTISKRIKSKN